MSVSVAWDLPKSISGLSSPLLSLDGGRRAGRSGGFLSPLGGLLSAGQAR